jgi:hypothetical protein
VYHCNKISLYLCKVKIKVHNVVWVIVPVLQGLL